MIVTKCNGMIVNADDTNFFLRTMEVRLERTGEFMTLSLVPEGEPTGLEVLLPKEIIEEIRKHE